MSSRKALNVIEVRKPCPADWDAMRGDDRARFCTHCQKNVYNLAGMSADEAQALICRSAGNLCARFARSETGDVLTLEYQPIKRRSRLRWVLLGIGALLTSAASVVAFVLDRPAAPIKTAALEIIRLPAPPATRPTYIMGDVCVSLPPAPVPQQQATDKAALRWRDLLSGKAEGSVNNSQRND